MSTYWDSDGHAFYENLFSSLISSQAALGAALSSIALVGSAENTNFGGVDIRPKYPTVEGITEPALVRKSYEDYVASPALKREVEVLVKPQRDASTSAPVLYLLDGVNADEVGDFLYQGDLSPIDDNVTIVMPTQARDSMWMDWEQEDPALGRNMWETFLTKELPEVVESEVNFNGKRAIGGISMGAGAAVMIANLNPGMYQAVLGISGCYSTLSDIGHQITYLNIHSRGGELDNLWGPFGSEGWQFHDVPRDPRGLANTLEVGVRTCTQELGSTLRRHGITKVVEINYTDYGSHEWLNFNQHFGPGWEYIKPALY